MRTESSPPSPPALHTAPGTSALVLDSPHSGTDYPADFRPACAVATLRQAEDTHVEKLYAFAPAMGVAWIEAFFPRIYLDANRDETELDTGLLSGPWPGPLATDPVVLQKVRLGKGLVWKFTDDGRAIYDRPLSVEEVMARIQRCWRPYHAAVAEAINIAHARHGYSIHINCHSMPAVASSHATLFPGLHHADFVVGDRDGTTASPALSALVCDFLRTRGYSVEYNHPYKAWSWYAATATRRSTGTASSWRSTASSTWTRPPWRLSRPVLPGCRRTCARWWPFYWRPTPADQVQASSGPNTGLRPLSRPRKASSTAGSRMRWPVTAGRSCSTRAVRMPRVPRSARAWSACSWVG